MTSQQKMWHQQLLQYAGTSHARDLCEMKELYGWISNMNSYQDTVSFVEYWDMLPGFARNCSWIEEQMGMVRGISMIPLHTVGWKQKLISEGNLWDLTHAVKLPLGLMAGGKAKEDGGESGSTTEMGTKEALAHLWIQAQEIWHKLETGASSVARKV
ncbi:hypothetical protein ACFX13_006339 [Malus domestica]